MNLLNQKLAALEKIYSVYEEFAHELETVCRQYCSQCCTRNVTMTSLEAYRIMEGKNAAERDSMIEKLQETLKKERFIPRITLNEMADRCMRDEEVPEESCNPAWTPCAFLENDECPLYADRPFGCRCMLSVQPCAESGFANMPPFAMSVNNVLLQYIEHIDANGYFGNMTDMLLFMASEENRRAYENGELTQLPENLIRNRPVPVLMIPPEHRTKIKAIFEKLQG